MVPIIFACDETTMRNSSACPLLFSTTLLKQSHRNKANAWRPLGFIYNLDLITSKEQKKRMSSDMKALRLHKIFDAVLQSFHDAQTGTSLKNVTLTLGESNTKVVDLKVPLFYIIGDMQGGDKMCCTSATYNTKLARPCRKCNIKGSQLADPTINCKKIKMTHIIKLILENKDEELRALNQYKVYSPFFKLDYGGCKYGIFSACCPVEPLHSLESGIMKYLAEILFDVYMKTVGAARLDTLVQALTELAKQRFFSSGKDGVYPRLWWKEGLSTLKDLEAKYRVGVLFTISVVALTTEGQALFMEVFKDQNKVNDLIECLEMVLCY